MYTHILKFSFYLNYYEEIIFYSISKEIVLNEGTRKKEQGRRKKEQGRGLTSDL